jgi:hypothetical protein
MLLEWVPEGLSTNALSGAKASSSRTRDTMAPAPSNPFPGLAGNPVNNQKGQQMFGLGVDNLNPYMESESDGSLDSTTTGGFGNAVGNGN